MTKIIKVVLLLMLLIVVVKANAQKGEDTMIGRIFVAQGAFNTYTAPDSYFGTVKYILNDANTGKPAEVAWASEWKCIKVTHSDYILSNSDVTISASKILPYVGQNKYWIVKQGGRGTERYLSISAFADKINMLAQQKKDSIAHLQQVADKVKEDSDVALYVRNKRAEYIKNYGEKNGNEVINGKIEIGFTEEMCKNAWGDPLPESQNDSNVNGDIVALWVYNRYPDRGKTVLYFKNGLLNDIQGPIK